MSSPHGDDAKPYQEREVRRSVEASKEPASDEATEQPEGSTEEEA